MQKGMFNIGELATLNNKIKFNKSNLIYDIHCKWVLKKFQYSSDLDIFSDVFPVNSNLSFKFNLSSKTIRMRSTRSSKAGMKGLRLRLVFLENANSIESYVFNACFLDNFLNTDLSSANRQLMFTKSYDKSYLKIEAVDFTELFKLNAFHDEKTDSLIIICNIGLKLKSDIQASASSNNINVISGIHVKNLETKIELLKDELINDLTNSIAKNKKDIVFKIGAEEISAHKYVLSSRSLIFSDMFKNNQKISVIEINDISSDIFKIVLDFIYTSNIENINSDNVTKIFETAEKYRITGLKNICEDILLNLIHKN